MIETIVSKYLQQRVKEKVYMEVPVILAAADG